MQADELEGRVTELEIRHAEQADLLAQLNEVLVAQQKSMDVLTLELHRLRQRLEAEPGLVDAQASERPPHY